jgi:hypothetical protein
MQVILTLIAAAFTSAAISFTITFTGVFKPVRDYISSVHPKAGELIHCPWCFNHYVVFIMLPLGGVPLIPVMSQVGFFSIIFNFFFTAFAIIGAAGVIHYVLLRAYEPVAKAEAFRKIQNRKPQ